MLTRTTAAQMEELLRREHPGWTPTARRDMARLYVETLDARLDEALARHAASGEIRDVAAGDFSLLAIRALRGCSYLEAAVLLDGYLKDPVLGRAKILRR